MFISCTLLQYKNQYSNISIFFFSLSHPPQNHGWQGEEREEEEGIVLKYLKHAQSIRMKRNQKHPHLAAELCITHPTKLWNDNFYLRKRERNQLLIMILNIFIFHNMIFTTINNHINIVSLSSAFVEMCESSNRLHTRSLFSSPNTTTSKAIFPCIMSHPRINTIFIFLDMYFG